MNKKRIEKYRIFSLHVEISKFCAKSGKFCGGGGETVTFRNSEHSLEQIEVDLRDDSALETRLTQAGRAGACNNKTFPS